MALSQSQWFEKLKGWVPDWFFETSGVQAAHFQAMAKLFSELETNLENHIGETFICQSEASFLEEHATERNIKKFLNELDSVLCLRVSNLVNTSDPISIKSIVDGFLIVGESIIVEHENNAVFLDRETFFDRGVAFSSIFYNFFTIIVDKQIRPPVTFMDRENFMDREDIYGQTESSINLFTSIVDAVNRAKAFGILFRLIERAA